MRLGHQPDAEVKTPYELESRDRDHGTYPLCPVHDHGSTDSRCLEGRLAFRKNEIIASKQARGIRDDTSYDLTSPVEFDPKTATHFCCNRQVRPPGIPLPYTSARCG